MTKTTSSSGCVWKMRAKLTGRMIRAASLSLVFVAQANAQWNDIDRSLPWALEACAAVNFQLERWETAITFFERVSKKHPDDAFAALGLARSLTEFGEHERAIAACERAKAFPAVRANALLQLAKNQAAVGDSKAALASLEQAVRAQLVDHEGAIKSDPAFASLRGEPRFKAIESSLHPVRERLQRLSKAADFDGLVALFHANGVLVEPGKTETSDLVLDELRSYAESVQKNRNTTIDADRLRLIGRAVDATLSEGCFEKYVDAWLGWSPEEIMAEKNGWSVLRGLGSSMRAHRFDEAIRRADEHARQAAARGDVLQLYHARVAASICHLAIRDYRQPRKGVSAEEESRLGTEKIREALAIARGLGIVSQVVESFDYLASHEIHRRSMAEEQFDQLICEAVVQSTRLAPGARELGVWEKLWRDRRLP